MHFLTEQESERWLTNAGRILPVASPTLRVARIQYPPQPYRIRYFARWIATSITYDAPALLWITESGIWSSSENWHLYYVLRQSSGDRRQLHEAPGHLFENYEFEAMASYLQLAMLNGWGGYILTSLDYVNAFFSHDEYIDFFAEREEQLEEVRVALAPKQS